jgi:hypothetical protein
MQINPFIFKPFLVSNFERECFLQTCCRCEFFLGEGGLWYCSGVQLEQVEVHVRVQRYETVAELQSTLEKLFVKSKTMRDEGV